MSVSLQRKLALEMHINRMNKMRNEPATVLYSMLFQGSYPTLPRMSLYFTIKLDRVTFFIVKV